MENDEAVIKHSVLVQKEVVWAAVTEQEAQTSGRFFYTAQIQQRNSLPLEAVGVTSSHAFKKLLEK